MAQPEVEREITNSVEKGKGYVTQTVEAGFDITRLVVRAIDGEKIWQRVEGRWTLVTTKPGIRHLISQRLGPMR